jgi:hypothetical protein
MESKLDNGELLNVIWNNILHNNGLKTRKYLIENEALFNSDWDQLLMDLLNFTYNQKIPDIKMKAMIIIMADHLEKSSRVIDKEINFFACLLKLEKSEDY